MLADVAAATILVSLAVYIVLGGADFGAGFWDLTAGGARRGARARELIHRSMAPVWEANHVWLIFVLVMLWTAFPSAFGAIMSTLYVPLFVAAIGIVLRGTAFAVRGEAATIAEHRALGATFALSSVLIPLALGAVIGGIASGRVPFAAAGDPLTSWWNPTSAFIALLAVATGAHLSAVYLAGDAARAGLPDLVRAFRARALGGGLVCGGMALAGLAVVRADAPRLYHGLSGRALPLVVLSGVAGISTLGLVRAGRFGLARATSATSVAAIAAGWALAQQPDLLPGQVTIARAAAGEATLTALLISVAAGMLLLVPSLWYLFRLVLQGRFDDDFRPLTADDDPAGRHG